jgi:hypothetical protein
MVYSGCQYGMAMRVGRPAFIALSRFRSGSYQKATRKLSGSYQIALNAVGKLSGSYLMLVLLLTFGYIWL